MAALRAIAVDWREESADRIKAAIALEAIDPAAGVLVLLAAAVDPDMDQPEQVTAIERLAKGSAEVRAALSWMMSEFDWGGLDVQHRAEVVHLFDHRTSNPLTRSAGLWLIVDATDMPNACRVAAGAELSTEGHDRAYEKLKSLTTDIELAGTLAEAIHRGSTAAITMLERLAQDPDVTSEARSHAKRRA